SALEKTKYKWVLSLDADERIPQETAETIKNIIKQPNASAYSFCRKNFFHGKWIKRCGWWPDRIIRLFDKSTGKFEGLVHERWVTYGKTINLQAYIEHYSFDNYSSMLKKLDVYSELAAIELFKKGVKPSIITPFSHSIWSFLKIYLLKQGFLEGLDGFIISFLNAAGHFFKYAKLIELYRYSDKIEYKH
ncbi:glycosyltransferase family 2 protein, partial [Thermodesulfatator indicus]